MLDRWSLASRSVKEREVTNRLPYDNAVQHTLWNRKRWTGCGDSRRVLVAHADVNIGPSIALLLGFKGFASIDVPDLRSARELLQVWQPAALLFDTRLDVDDDFAFVRAFTADPSNANRLFIGMTSIWPDDSLDELKSAGFDGHCRRPCPIWRLADILNDFFR